LEELHLDCFDLCDYSLSRLLFDKETISTDKLNLIKLSFNSKNLANPEMMKQLSEINLDNLKHLSLNCEFKDDETFNCFLNIKFSNLEYLQFSIYAKWQYEYLSKIKFQHLKHIDLSHSNVG
jgi:hypothetical protein